MSKVVTCMLSCISRVRLFATLWTVALQAPPSMGFSRQEYCRGLPFPPPGDLPNPGIEPASAEAPALPGRFFTPKPPGKFSSWPRSSIRQETNLLLSHSLTCSFMDLFIYSLPDSSIHSFTQSRKALVSFKFSGLLLTTYRWRQEKPSIFWKFSSDIIHRANGPVSGKALNLLCSLRDSWDFGSLPQRNTFQVELELPLKGAEQVTKRLELVNQQAEQSSLPLMARYIFNNWQAVYCVS